jgi:hypothetical protein
MQDTRIARGLILPSGDSGVFFKYIDILMAFRQLKCHTATDDAAANNRDIYFLAHKDNSGIYSNCQKYVPIDLAGFSKVIASEAISQVFQKIASSLDSSQ